MDSGYELLGEHSIREQRERGRHDDLVSVSCSLRVSGSEPLLRTFALLMQCVYVGPHRGVELLAVGRPDPREWTFMLRGRFQNARTRNWLGRRLSIERLSEEPAALLRAFHWSLRSFCEANHLSLTHAEPPFNLRITTG